MSRVLQCHGCRHYAWGSLDRDRCTAFLDGIPDQVWLGDVDHAEPVRGDGGVRREPVDGATAAANVRRRRDVWAKRRVERMAHDADPLGAIVAGVDRDPFATPLDAATVAAAWRSTSDAPAMLLVLLKARRVDALARAIQLTCAQLDLEGCDYLEDKHWLGVTLCLTSYQTESAFANAPAAWSALSSPFGDGYITTRVHQALLRNFRRVVPEPPPASEWASGDLAIEGVGPLDDAVIAMRLRPLETLARAEDLPLLEPWTAVTNAQGLEAELARELTPGHRLFGRAGLRAVARRTDGDEVLFVDDTLAAVVHLTWAKDAELASPRVELFASVDDWLAQRMNPDHDAFAGQAPRAFAFELGSTLGLAEMKDRLPDRTRWEWTIGDSAWYGDYVWGKDGATRVRLFAEDEPGRFTVQVDIVDHDDRGSDWFDVTRAFVVHALLPSIEASDAIETTPKYD